MLMRIKEVGVSRAPDIQILLPENLGLLEPKQVVGASDLVVEVVSEGSERIDRIQKFSEYEKAGVKEYWIIDPIHREALFYQLNTDGLYARLATDQAMGAMRVPSCADYGCLYQLYGKNQYQPQVKF